VSQYNFPVNHVKDSQMQSRRLPSTVRCDV